VPKPYGRKKLQIKDLFGQNEKAKRLLNAFTINYLTINSAEIMGNDKQE